MEASAAEATAAAKAFAENALRTGTVAGVAVGNVEIVGIEEEEDIGNIGGVGSEDAGVEGGVKDGMIWRGG